MRQIKERVKTADHRSLVARFLAAANGTAQPEAREPPGTLQITTAELPSFAASSP